MQLLTSSDAPYILHAGGARAGKTIAICRWLILRAFQFPRSKQLVVRLRQVDLWGTSWLSMIEHLRDYFSHDSYTVHKKEMKISFVGGSFIKFSGLDTQERMDFILGSEWLTIFFNECTQGNYDMVTTMMTRLAQKVVHRDSGQLGLPKFVMDCNPKHSRHWVAQLCIQNVMPGSDPLMPLPEKARWKHLHWTPYDNAEHLPNSFFDVLDSLPDIKRKRMRDGIWADNEDAVYNEFDEDVHCIEHFDIPSHWRRVRGIDFGFVHAFCCLWGAIDGDGRLYVYNELYVKGMIVSDAAQLINTTSMGEKYEFTVADWDAEDNATLQRSGIGTVNANKAISLGIETVKKRLRVQADGKPRLYIAKDRCPNLISEMYSYVRDPKGNKEDPKKEHDDCADPLRYMCMRLDHWAGVSVFQGVYDDKDRQRLVTGF